MATVDKQLSPALPKYADQKGSIGKATLGQTSAAYRNSLMWVALSVPQTHHKGPLQPYRCFRGIPLQLARRPRYPAIHQSFKWWNQIRKGGNLVEVILAECKIRFDPILLTARQVPTQYDSVPTRSVFGFRTAFLWSSQRQPFRGLVPGCAQSSRTSTVSSMRDMCGRMSTPARVRKEERRRVEDEEINHKNQRKARR